MRVERRNLLGTAAAALVLGASCPASARIQLNLSSALSEWSFTTRRALRFTETVEEATGGRS